MCVREPLTINGMIYSHVDLCCCCCLPLYDNALAFALTGAHHIFALLHFEWRRAHARVWHFLAGYGGLAMIAAD